MTIALCFSFFINSTQALVSFFVTERWNSTGVRIGADRRQGTTGISVAAMWFGVAYDRCALRCRRLDALVDFAPRPDQHFDNFNASKFDLAREED